MNFIIKEKALIDMLKKAYRSGWYGNLELCDGDVEKIIDDNRKSGEIVNDTIISNDCYFKSIDYGKVTLSPSFVIGDCSLIKTVGDG